MTARAGKVLCAECDREVDELLTIAERWRWWSDGCGQLLVFCPACSKREFGHMAGARFAP
jgi:hypothetical protein